MSSRLPLLLALLLTGLNAAKPVVIDDTAYLQFARQIAAAPLDPYGFEMIWYQDAGPAFDILLPPALPYWLAIGMRLFGENVVLLKLWLFPILWLFTASLACVIRRFCPNNADMLLTMTALSPTFLPGINLMLDVPAFALSLAALCCLLRPVRFGGLWGGLLLGLAMQTKYAALAMPVVLLLYGWRFGCLRRALAIVGIGATFFVAWECAMAAKYGHSHFLLHSRYQDETMVGLYAWRTGVPYAEASRFAAWRDAKERLVAPLFGNLGGIFPAIAILGWLGLGCRRVAILGIVLVILHLAAVVVLPSQNLNSFCLNAFGGSAILVVLLCAWKDRRSAEGKFLIAWFAWELLCYFALSPFGCVRRLMGLTLVGTLICGRALDTASPPRLLVRTAAGLGIALGLFYFAVDFRDGLVEKHAAERAMQCTSGGGQVYFTGHWGFQWYCEERGMREIWPGRSRFEAGDWLVVPLSNRPSAQEIQLPADCVRLHDTFTVDWRPGVSTISDYYCGKIPLRVRTEPRMEVAVYKVLKAFISSADRANP